MNESVNMWSCVNSHTSSSFVSHGGVFRSARLGVLHGRPIKDPECLCRTTPLPSGPGFLFTCSDRIRRGQAESSAC